MAKAHSNVAKNSQRLRPHQLLKQTKGHAAIRVTMSDLHVIHIHRLFTLKHLLSMSTVKQRGAGVYKFILLWILHTKSTFWLIKYTDILLLPSLKFLVASSVNCRWFCFHQTCLFVPDVFFYSSMYTLPARSPFSCLEHRTGSRLQTKSS